MTYAGKMDLVLWNKMLETMFDFNVGVITTSKQYIMAEQASRSILSVTSTRMQKRLSFSTPERLFLERGKLDMRQIKE